MKALKILGGVLAALALVVLALPMLIPLPPLEDTQPAAELAEVDSRFVNVNGLQVHYKESGEGQPVVILLHGFGASVFSWREVLDPLGEGARVIAYDRPAFGLTQRPMPGEWSGESPYSLESQVSLLTGLMDALGVEKAVLVGNSAGGTVALQTALSAPQRVAGLVLVDAAVYSEGSRFGRMGPLLNSPQLNRWGPVFARSIAGEPGDVFIRSAWHDPSRLTPEILEGYRKPLRAENWDRALWELTKASGTHVLAGRLGELNLPVLVVTGDDDQIVPTAGGLGLAEEIPGAGLAVFPACGHVPQEECPRAFLEAVQPFVDSLGSQ